VRGEEKVLTPLMHGFSDSFSKSYFHAGCIESVKREVAAFVFRCPACGTGRSPHWTASNESYISGLFERLSFETTCRSCGHYHDSPEVRKCCACYLPLFSGHSIPLDKRRREFCHRACIWNYRRRFPMTAPSTWRVLFALLFRRVS
jgi:hypothetical protein